jgi:hypothetical protein
MVRHSNRWIAEMLIPPAAPVNVSYLDENDNKATL